jgi:hypothetical protein
VQSAVTASTHSNADVRLNSKSFSCGGCRSELRGRSGSEHGECVGRERRVFVFVFVLVFVFVEQATCRSVGTLTSYVRKERNKFEPQSEVK